VRTGLAVRAGEPLPAIGDRAALRACLVAARAIWLPDPERATAGIHFVKVLRALGIHDAVAARLRPFPNGATAMRTMADEGEPGSVGCTQVTEILYTPGVALAGPLPAEFELATVYSVAVASGARDPALARRFTALVAGEASRGLRAAGGFED
jgi:molybdate transport system substrate-binding protein